jgi:hypothetical protein
MRVINLKDSTESLLAVCATAHDSVPLHIVAPYYTFESLDVPVGAGDVYTNGTTPVTVVGAPATDQYVIKDVNVYNNDTITHAVTLYKLDGANAYKIRSWVIEAGGYRTLEPETHIYGGMESSKWETDDVVATAIMPKNGATVEGRHLSGVIDCGIFQP